MKTLFKVALIVLCVGTQGYAQKTHERTTTEEFNTNKDVEIKVNTRYTDIIIEPWSKNLVRVEATIIVEGVSDERAVKTLDNWNFKALGNKSQVEITTREGNLLFSSNSFDFNGPVVLGEYDNMLNNLAVDLNTSGNDNHVIVNGHHISSIGNNLVMGTQNGNFVYLDSLGTYNYNYDFPNALAISSLRANIPEFDYEKFEKDQEYIVEWQKEMKESMEKFKVAQKKAAKMNATESKKFAVKQAELQKQLSKNHAQLAKNYGKLTKERAELAKLKSLEIKHLLDNREKIKVTKTIVIRAPKNAKFNLDTKYGTVRFSK